MHQVLPYHEQKQGKVAFSFFFKLCQLSPSKFYKIQSSQNSGIRDINHEAPSTIKQNKYRIKWTTIKKQSSSNEAKYKIKIEWKNLDGVLYLCGCFLLMRYWTANRATPSLSSYLLQLWIKHSSWKVCIHPMGMVQKHVVIICLLISVKLKKFNSHVKKNALSFQGVIEGSS